MRPELQLHHDDGEFVVGGFGSLVVPIWWRTTTVADLERLAAVQAGLIEAYGSSSSIPILNQRLSLNVDDGIRAKGAEIARRFGGKIAAAALVVPQRGLRATMIRSITTGIFLLARSKAKHRVFHHVIDAVNWVDRVGVERPSASGEVVAEAIEAVARRDEPLS